MKNARKHTGPHIFIATPVHSGQVCAEYVKSLMDTLPALAQNGVAYTHSFIIGNALVHDARNRLVSWFLASEATDMLFIDADICWDADDAVRLARSPHDVIGGAYPQKREDRELYNVAGLKPTGTHLLETDYLGGGFVKVSGRAIKKMIEAYPETKYQDPEGGDCYGLFQAPIVDGKLTGEDAFFFRQWRKIGGKVFLEPNMTLIHMGNKAFVGNFAKLAERQMQNKGAA